MNYNEQLTIKTSQIQNPQFSIALSLEYFIAKRIYFSKEGDRQATPPVVRIAMIGIALGLAVMILSVAIVIGFKKEIRNKVIGFGSHIQITNFDNNASYESTPIAVSDTLLEHLKTFPGITHVEGFATKPGILKTDSDFQGIVLKGVGRDYDWTFFRNNLKEGELFILLPIRCLRMCCSPVIWLICWG